MTIIAFRDGVLAADSMVSTYGGTRSSQLIKIHQVECHSPNSQVHGVWLIGAAGSPAAIVPIRQWVLDGAELSKPVDFGKIEDSTGLLISPQDVIYNVDTAGGFVMLNAAPFAAIGSGTDSALGAMLMGATALQAVEVAKQVDLGCGGSTNWLSKTDGYTEFDKEIYKVVN